MSKDTGGPAFPVDSANEAGHQTGPNTWQFTGMTLRDYFAAKALSGMASAYHEHWTTGRLAEAAYELADAMTAERLK